MQNLLDWVGCSYKEWFRNKRDHRSGAQKFFLRTKNKVLKDLPKIENIEVTWFLPYCSIFYLISKRTYRNPDKTWHFSAHSFRSYISLYTFNRTERLIIIIISYFLIALLICMPWRSKIIFIFVAVTFCVKLSDKSFDQTKWHFDTMNTVWSFWAPIYARFKKEQSMNFLKFRGLKI